MPRLRSQFEGSSPDPGYPQLGRDEMDRSHAVFSIVQSLASLGLSDWLPTLMQWLGRYDGLETLLEDQYDPAICVREVLLRHVVRRSAIGVAPAHAKDGDTIALKRAIVDDLMRLDFVCFRVCFLGNQDQPQNWKPLEQSFLSFRDSRAGDEQLHGWYTERVEPIVAELSRFLLAGGPSGADSREPLSAPPQ